MELSKLSLGFEFGSTRIKAVVIDSDHQIIADSSYSWENSYCDGVWTYSMEEVEVGMRETFRGLLEDFEKKHGQKLTTVGSMGISGMMHGYLVLDKNDKVLAPFRTWRNTMTEQETIFLSELFNFHVPQRWTIAHLYHSVTHNAKELNEIVFATTLAGYIHYRLTGEKVIGIGEASGIFPIDPATKDYDKAMIQKFDEAIKGKANWKAEEVLPKVLCAGVEAGKLTKEGAEFLDPSHTFLPGVTFVPPEGDMGTGMVATNSVKIGSGNASIGTSNNLTIITGKVMEPNPAIDVIVSPSGTNAALIHINNGTTDINDYVSLIEQVIDLFGEKPDKGVVFAKLFNLALEGEKDCGGLLNYNTAAGEPILEINEGRPLLLRTPDAKLLLPNLIRSCLYSAFCPVRMGIDTLSKEGVHVDVITGHGGFFKTPEVGAKIMSAATKATTRNLYSSAEGGPYGMALLAAYYLEKKDNESLEDYLEEVFRTASSIEIDASEEDKSGFDRYYEKYVAALPVLRKATEKYKA